VTHGIIRPWAWRVFGAVVAAAAIGLVAGSHTTHAQDPAKPQAPLPMPQLNTIQDVFNALERCWRANEPPLDQARPGMNVTVVLSFTRSGALQGEPRFTYVTREASAETKALYQRAAVAALNACVPLPFTEALGNAVAGHPFAMRFIDVRLDPRNLKGT
jgi:hypothetical protein